MLFFSFHISINHPFLQDIENSSTFMLNTFQKCIRIGNNLSHFSLWKVSVSLEKNSMLFFFLPHFNDSSTPVEYCKSLHKFPKCFLIWNYLPHFSLWKISLQLGKILCSSFPFIFQSIFHPCRILKISFPHLSWKYFRNVFEYEIIFHISDCGRFL